MIAVILTYLSTPWSKIKVSVDLSSVRTPIRSYVHMKDIFNTSCSIPWYSLHSIYYLILTPYHLYGNIYSQHTPVHRSYVSWSIHSLSNYKSDPIRKHCWSSSDFIRFSFHLFRLIHLFPYCHIRHTYRNHNLGHHQNHRHRNWLPISIVCIDVPPSGRIHATVQHEPINEITSHWNHLRNYNLWFTYRLSTQCLLI